MIYFVACPGAGAVKIGHAEKRSYLTDDASAFERVSGLQVGCPLELKLLATCEGGKSEEAALHLRFAAHRIRGEWFQLTDELRTHIAQFPKPERRQRGWHSQARNRADAA